MKLLFVLLLFCCGLFASPTDGYKPIKTVEKPMQKSSRTYAPLLVDNAQLSNIAKLDEANPGSGIRSPNVSKLRVRLYRTNPLEPIMWATSTYSSGRLFRKPNLASVPAPQINLGNGTSLRRQSQKRIRFKSPRLMSEGFFVAVRNALPCTKL